MPDCHLCHATPAIEPPGQHPLCKDCFCRGIDKRVRKSLWEQQWLKPGSSIRFIDDGTPAAAACKAIMAGLLAGFPHSVADADDSISIFPDTMDDEVSGRFAAVLNGEDTNHTAQDSVQQRVLTPLLAVTSFEAKLYADAKGLQYSAEKPQNPHIESLEHKYPGTKFALLKSLQKF